MKALEYFIGARWRRDKTPTPSLTSQEERLLSVGVRAALPHMAPSDQLSSRVWRLADAAEQSQKRRRIRRRSAGVSIAAVGLVTVGINAPQVAARVGLFRAAGKLKYVQETGSLRVTREDFSTGHPVTSTLRTDGTNSLFTSDGMLISQDEAGTRSINSGRRLEFPGELIQYGEYGQLLKSSLDLKEQSWLTQAAYPFVVRWKNFPDFTVSVSRPDPQLIHWSLDGTGRLSSALLLFDNKRVVNVNFDPATGLPTKMEERPEDTIQLAHRMLFTTDVSFPANWTRHTEGKRSPIEEHERQEYLKQTGSRVLQTFPFSPVDLYIHDAFRTPDGDVFVLYSAQEGASASNYRLVREKIALELSAVDQSGIHYTPVKTKSSFVYVNGTLGGAVPLLVGPTVNKTPAQCFWLTPTRPPVKAVTRRETHTFHLFPKGSVEANDILRLIINGDVKKYYPIPVLDEEPLVLKESHWPATLRGTWASNLSGASLAQLRIEARKAYRKTHPNGP